MKSILIALAALATMSLPATAQFIAAPVPGDCDNPVANARYIYSPTSLSVREFDDGNIRMIALDEGREASGSGMNNRGTFHIMLTFQRPDSTSVVCALISASEFSGFSTLSLADISNRMVSDGSLVLVIPVTLIVGGDMLFDDTLILRVNRTRGTVRTKYASEEDLQFDDELNINANIRD